MTEEMEKACDKLLEDKLYGKLHPPYCKCYKCMKAIIDRQAEELKAKDEEIKRLKRIIELKEDEARRHGWQIVYD